MCSDFAAAVLFTDECTFARDGAFNTQNEHVWPNVNLHAAYPHARQRRFSINVWTGTIGENLIGPYLLPERLHRGKYFTLLQEILPDLLEDLPTDIRRRMWCSTVEHQPIMGERCDTIWA